MAATALGVCFLSIFMSSYMLALMFPQEDKDSQKSTDPKSDIKCCSVSYSASHQGHVVDCTNCGLTFINTSLLPEDTVSLTLDNNNITKLQNNAFATLKYLRNLSIEASNVQEIDVNALQGLVELKVLNLQSNKLTLRLMKFPKTMFRHVPNLTELYLAYQEDGDKEKSSDSKTYTSSTKRRAIEAHEGVRNVRHTNRAFNKALKEIVKCHVPLKNYSNVIDIFRYLEKLTTLSIDGLNTTLHLGEEFSNLTLLSNITINGPDVKCIANFSFTGLWPLHVRALSLINMDQISINTNYQSENNTHFDDDAFQHLTSLTHLTIDGCRIGNQNIARKMKHFVNMTMTSIVLKTTHFSNDFKDPGYMMEDVILKKTTMKYLVQIHLSHFSWTDSNIFSFVPRGFNSPVWQHSIKSMDLSNNNFGHLGWKVNFIDLYLLKNIQTLTLSDIYATFDEIHPTLEGPTAYGKTNVNVRVKDTNIALSRQGSSNSSGITGSVERATGVIRLKEFSIDRLPQLSFHEPVELTTLINIAAKAFPSRSGLWTLALAPSMSIIRFVGVMTGLSDFSNCSVRFINTEYFTHFYFINNEIIRGYGHVYGLANLQLIDLTGSTLIVEEHFFDHMPSLRYLILKSIRPDDFFVRLSCERLIRNLTELIYLDMSDNKLNRLPTNLFATNPNVTHLILNKNRFSGIPFDLTSTPNLEFLDLTGNAIISLDEQELVALSRHADLVPHFSLGLAGNNIACGCFQTKFLAWIDNSKFLDMRGNYSCTFEDDHLTNTGIILSDLQGFWRHCNGSTSLMLSLILAFIMALAFLMAHLLSRFKTAIVAFIMKLFTSAFRPMTADDYKTHVFIGYGDEDCHFVRYTLGRYLEHDLGVSTFIHQRDLGPGYTDQQLFEAIRDSWRILLVITSNFLLNYDQATIVMKYASHSMTSLNHDRVLVLVQQSQVKNIPDYLFDVLDDTRIIVLTDLKRNLSYQQSQRIRECLRSP